MSNFKVKGITITKEVNGAIPANPKLLKICFEDFTLKDVPNTEEIECLLKDGVQTFTTDSSIEGGAKHRLDAQTMPFVLTHTLGTPVSTADATSTDWTASTATTVNTIVNLSDGKHSLVATRVYGDTLTGTVEPTESGRDGNVKWVKVNRLQIQEYEYKEECPKFTAEYHLSDGTDDFYQQFSGAEIKMLPLNIDGEASTFEVDLDFSASTAVNSEDEAWVNNLEAIAGAKTITLDQDRYGASCETTKVKINDVDVEDTESVTMTIDKGITEKKSLNCQVSSSRKLKVTGEIKEDFTIERFNMASMESKFKLGLNLGTKIGSYAHFTFDSVYRSKASADLNARDDVTLSPTLTAESTSTTPIVKATIVAPMLIADDGTIVGAY